MDSFTEAGNESSKLHFFYLIFLHLKTNNQTDLKTDSYTHSMDTTQTYRHMEI